MNIKQALARLVERQNLTEGEMITVMREVMSGGATEAQIGGFLVALRMKSETLDEITGAARVMRELATPVEISADNLVDTCGTGGDGANLFNVSTAAAFVVAAAGGKVAKHGNRSVSSSTGSADLLESAGINLDMDPAQVARCIEAIGVGFMFAPAHHGAMKYAIGPRKELGMRTIFNILGPLTNPAGVKRQVVGVFNQALCRPLAEVLGRLGSEHVLVVHSEDNLDEISLAAHTHVAELRGGEVTEYRISPADFNIPARSMLGLQVSGAQESLEIIVDAFGPRKRKEAAEAADVIAMNAGAAIYVSGQAATLAMGVAVAEDIIASGLANEKMKELAEFSQC
jgi:anthranilate phosphoribosyltransferase